MNPAFVIHASSSSDRKTFVQDLVKETGASIVEAILDKNPLIGCCLSHLKVAGIAKQMYPTVPYMVFEDDCILSPDWKAGVLDLSGDVCYLGYNEKSSDKKLFGTHAMIITPRARDHLIQFLSFCMELTDHPAYDHMCWNVWKGNRLRVDFPDVPTRWCHQAKGIKSLITGEYRV